MTLVYEEKKVKTRKQAKLVPLTLFWVVYFHAQWFIAFDIEHNVLWHD
jgi:hypothetical protein